MLLKPDGAQSCFGVRTAFASIRNCQARWPLAKFALQATMFCLISQAHDSACCQAGRQIAEKCLFDGNRTLRFSAKAREFRRNA